MKESFIPEIISGLNNYEPEEIIIRIDKAILSADIPFIEITVQINEVNEVSERKWRISLNSYLSGQVSTDTACFMEHTNDHSLLWEYNDLQASLYFTGAPDDIYKLYWDLHNIHTYLYGSRLGVEKYLNTGRKFDDLMKAQYGLLANGPKKLLTKLAECLQKHGVKSTIVNERKPSFWNGHKYVAELRELSLLFIGDSYFIAEEFKAEDIA
jgi:hypothetical protein